MKTIIRPRDVVELANMTLPGNACTFRQLFNIEVFEFRHSLGTGFRLALLDQLEDYSSALIYKANLAYAAGDVVKYQVGEALEYYKAKVNVTANQIPTDADKWMIAPRFKDSACQDAFTELYCDYLAEWLSLSVMIKRLPFLFNSITDKGVLQYDGLSYNASNRQGQLSLFHALDTNRSIVFSNMVAWLLAKKDDACFSTINFSQACSCVNKRKGNARYNKYRIKIG